MQSTFCLIHLLFYPLDELPMCMLSSIYFNFLVENMKIAVGKCGLQPTRLLGPWDSPWDSASALQADSLLSEQPLGKPPYTY